MVVLYVAHGVSARTTTALLVTVARQQGRDVDPTALEGTADVLDGLAPAPG